jgi:hypothetical protein
LTVVTEEEVQATNCKRAGINVNEIKLHTPGEALLKRECTQMINMFVDS